MRHMNLLLCVKDIYAEQKSYFYHLCHTNDTMLINFEAGLLAYWSHTVSFSARKPNIARFFRDVTEEMHYTYEDILYRELL